MALSEHEQQMLKEIEQSLLSEDPKFGAVVTDGDFAQSKGTVTLRGIAIVVIGLVLLVTGVALSQMSLWWLSLSILGFLVMLPAACGCCEVVVSPLSILVTDIIAPLDGGDHRNLGDWGIGWRIIFAVVLKTSYNVT